MAQDYSIRFTGDTSQLQKALNDTKERFNNISKSSVSLSRKIGAIKKELENMAVTGIDATDEGKEMWQTLSDAAKQYDEMLKRIQADTRAVGTESEAVADGGGISGDNGGLSGMLKNVDFKSVGTDLAGKAGLGGVAKAAGALAGAINPLTIGLTAVGGTMIAAGKASAEFEVHLNSLQALTGLKDAEMKAVSDGAIEMSKNFKSSAGEIVDAMKLIGSQAPELLKDSDALMKVTEAANVLSEAAEISVEDAAKAITGTMNQMGASASQATEIINTFAAASQQGSADVAYLNKAFEKAGTAASGAGMDFVQLASAVEAVAPKFSSADVAGSQLASTLLKLSMSGKSDFMPSVVGMSEALANLAKAEMDDVAMKNLVGESNITMLKTLIDARDAFDGYSESLRGTNTAYEQMETNQKGFSGAITKMKSAWEAFLLTLGQSGVMQGITDNIIMIINAINEIINVVSDVIKAFEEFGDVGVDNLNLFKYQIDLVINTIKAIGTAIEIVVRIIAKCFNGIVDAVKFARDGAEYHWNQVKKTLGDIAFVRAIINAFNKVLDGAANMCAQIKKYWNKLKEFLGMKVEASVDTKVNHVDASVPETPSITTTPSSTPSGSGKKKGSGGTKTTSTKTEKIDYLVSVDDNSLDTAEKKLSAWTAKKKTLNIDDVEAIEKCDEEIRKWQKEVERRKIILNGVEVTAPKFLPGSLNELKDQIKKKAEEIELALNTCISPESMQEMQRELDALRKKEKEKSIELGITKNSATIQKDNSGWSRGSVEDKKQSLSNAQGMVKEMQENYKLKLIGKDEVQSQITEINNQLESLGLKPITLSFNDDGTLTTAVEDLERYKDKMNSVADITGSVGNVFGSLGSAIGGTSGEIMNFAGQTIGAVAQIIPQIVSLIAAKEAEALAAGTASGAAMPFPANIAAIASIIATIAGIFASLPSFESGGVVPGNSYHGDRLLARVNSGEGILTRNGIRNLQNLYDSAGLGQSAQNTLKGDVNFTISGAALKGTLRNYDSKMSKIK